MFFHVKSLLHLKLIEIVIVGIIIETTTGDGDPNPYPTTCTGATGTSGTDNGRALIENNCTKNIREICTGPVWFTVSGGLHGWNLNSE